MSTKTLLGLALCFALAAGCAGGGDDDDSGPVAESEPNDSEGAADVLGAAGTHSFQGSCEPGGTDFWKATAGTGPISASVTWADAGGEDIDLYVYTADFSLDLFDDTVPPNDSPAQVTGTVTTAGEVFLEVDCFTNTATAYSGTITVP